MGEAVTIYNQDTEMEFAMEKCAMLIMKYGKQLTTEAINLPKQKRLEKRKLTNTWETDTI